MLLFDLKTEEQWNPQHHVERVLGKIASGDVTVACWEPGQVSPYHAHPGCTEIHFCYEGGGRMRTPERTVNIVPGSLVMHPPGELHEYVSGRGPSEFVGSAVRRNSSPYHRFDQAADDGTSQSSGSRFATTADSPASALSVVADASLGANMRMNATM